MSGTKVCNQCQIEQPIDQFHRRRLLGPDGRVGMCRGCSKLVASAYYEKNKDKILKTHKIRRDTDPDKYRTIEAISRRRNPERNRERVRKRRAKLAEAKAVEGAEHVKFSKLFERDAGVCYLCRQAVTLDTVVPDHVVPISRGGIHAYSNVRIACDGCNTRKRDRLIEELDPSQWPQLVLPLSPVGRPPDPPYVDLSPIEGEEWRSLVRWEGRYEVSSHGRVRSLPNKWFDGVRLLRPKITKTGYVQYALPRVDGKGKHQTQFVGAHRLVAETFLPRTTESDNVVMHRDHDRRNNHYSNLLWGTHQRNMADKKQSGRSPRGVRAWNAKLTEATVRDVVAGLCVGETIRAISLRTGVGRPSIASIKAGRSWGWLTGVSVGVPLRRGSPCCPGSTSG